MNKSTGLMAPSEYKMLSSRRNVQAATRYWPFFDSKNGLKQQPYRPLKVEKIGGPQLLKRYLLSLALISLMTLGLSGQTALGAPVTWALNPVTFHDAETTIGSFSHCKNSSRQLSPSHNRLLDIPS